MKQADRLEKWHDGDQADAYLTKFETVMTECDIPKEQWRGRLVNCLTGRALTAYRSVMEGGEPMDYDNLKDKLLEAMGLGLDQTRRKFWNPSKRMLESPLDMLRRLDSSYSRITRDCSTPAQLRQEIVIGRFLSLYPDQAAQYLHNYLDSHLWKKRSLDNSRPTEVSGFGRGTGNGGGDPRYSKEYSGTKSQYSREKQGRDEWRGKDERFHKKDTSDKIPVCRVWGKHY